MEKKMKFTCGCHGATVFSGEIPAPEISLKCEKCGETMVLISGIGAINSGIHSFIAECPKCREKQKYENYNLWTECRQSSFVKYGKNPQKSESEKYDI